MVTTRTSNKPDVVASTHCISLAETLQDERRRFGAASPDTAMVRFFDNLRVEAKIGGYVGISSAQYG